MGSEGSQTRILRHPPASIAFLRTCSILLCSRETLHESSKIYAWHDLHVASIRFQLSNPGSFHLYSGLSYNYPSQAVCSHSRIQYWSGISSYSDFKGLTRFTRSPLFSKTRQRKAFLAG